MKSLKVLAIIPARGGSKGVPKKNITHVAGKPLIQYAVDCALEASSIDHVLINSDSQEILDSVENKDDTRLSKQKRPKSLGQDNSSVVDVVLDAIERLEETYDVIVLLQVTSPIRDAKQLNEIVEMFHKEETLEAVISVIPMDDMHPARMYQRNDDGSLVSLVANAESKRRQDLTPVYYRNGCFYAIKPQILKKYKSFMPPDKKAYVMNANHLLNIDAPRDLMVAEVLIKAWLNKKL